MGYQTALHFTVTVNKLHGIAMAALLFTALTVTWNYITITVIEDWS